ncbi:MAG: putative deoxyribonuclease [Promethearchaeota archaeon CR_4]|nr:MAG: putative deoxyribonuclease [Candidatus Lokiarchaeota archaeon CR_4]
MVLSMSLSLEEGRLALRRNDPYIAWGVGCHPRQPKWQQTFHPAQFEEMVQKTVIIGEIGIDSGSRVPIQQQLSTFRIILDILSNYPRFISIHSYQATGAVLQELRQRPVNVPVLHWWTGTVAQTSEAVELGCYFSIHSQVARHSKFRCHVPLERVLVESDHGQDDPPPAIPHRICWAEYLVAQ